MIMPFRLALLATFVLATFVLATTAVGIAGCSVECSEGEAYNDEAELCMPVESVSS